MAQDQAGLREGPVTDCWRIRQKSPKAQPGRGASWEWLVVPSWEEGARVIETSVFRAAG